MRCYQDVEVVIRTVLRMLATTSSIFTPVVVAPSVPQSISMCAGVQR